ncbi:MAG: hypothetical protein RBG1_1C00001G1036 [candidate division Zixibacteria bacterium RBG-1]|nr:MAG: hypothetical protein RBG1_1C00001G1036 [candidate division Zixibacteria bacterium RBG-1]OGC85716.1 MAG: hypothetical protein A2V73_01390 [candidate division Zixibacteria bacterium RBG_19FT_COMBO_42_43]
MINRPKLKELEGKLSYYLVGLLFLALPFSIALSETISAILILVWVFKIILKRKFRPAEYPLFYPILGFVFFRLISIFFSVDFQDSLKGFEKLWLPLVYFPLASLDLSPSQKKSIFKVILVGAGLLALLSGLRVWLGQTPRASFLSTGYYTAAVYSTLVLGLALAGFVYSQRLKEKIYLGLVVTILTLGIFLTFTRACYLAALVMFLFVVVKKSRKILFIIALAAILAALIPNLKEKLGDRLSLRSPQLLSNRPALWGAGLEKLKDLPLAGYGPNTFNTIFPGTAWEKVEDKETSSWHNEFLQIILESGIFTFLFFGAMFLRQFFFSIRKLKYSLNSLNSAFQMGTILGILSWFLVGWFSLVSFDPVIGLFIWSGWGLSLKFTE